MMRLKDIKECAEFGDPIFQLLFGALHWFLDGPAADHEPAVKWVKLAAEKGSKEAAYMVYLMHSEQNGDDSLSLPWLEKSAKAGFAPAQLLWGFYETSNARGKNFKNGLSWIKKAAEQDYVPAVYHLATLYLNGIGVKEDSELGLRLLRDAAEKGFPDSAHMLGMKLIETKQDRDIREGLKWIKESAASDHFASNFFLWRVYQQGQCGVPRDEDLAEMFRLRAERIKPEAFKD